MSTVEEKKELAVQEASPPLIQAFSSMSGFETAQRMAKALSESDLIPTVYQKKIANCLVALEIAQRCQASVLMVMQNLYVIHGKPSWSSQYVIAAINSCGKFSPLRYKMGTDDEGSCLAYAIEHRSGEVLEGPKVSIKMAKAEGWYQKNGSKWQTLPELMLRYRAAAFFGRLYAPEVLMGLHSQDEVEDFIETTARVIDHPVPAETKDLSAKIAAQATKADSLAVDPSGAFAKFMGPEDPRLVK